MTEVNAPPSRLDAAVDIPADSERWYVARTLPQREFHAARQLNNQGFRTFVPRFWKNRRHARKVETISAPLFPRYIFVVVDRTRDRWRSINGTLGVDRLLMYGGEPQAVVPAGRWFGATVIGEFALVGCTVAPGFDFKDFEMAKRESMINEFPQHSAIIQKLTRE